MQRIPHSVKTHPLGATSKEMAVSIVLVIIIAVCFTYVLSSLLSSGNVGSDNNELHFECQQCKKEFVIMGEEFRQLRTDHDVLSKHKNRSVGMPNCPHCAEKHTGLLMTQCPKCSEHFLRNKVNIRTMPDNYVPPPPICPHCNTDIDQYLREQLKND